MESKKIFDLDHLISNISYNYIEKDAGDNNKNNLYSEIYNVLNSEVGVITFMKKDGSARNMLATRNLSTVMLGGYDLALKLKGFDNKCNIHNGNIGVIDLMIGECRQFNIGRLSIAKWYGVINNKYDLEKLKNEFEHFNEVYKQKIKEITEINMDNLI